MNPDHEETKRMEMLPNEAPKEEETKGLIETAIKDESKQSTIYH